MATRGFFGRRRDDETSRRLPPGQHVERGFPVLTAGPTQHIATHRWSFTLKQGPRPIKTWSWEAFNAVAQSEITTDIHCVTSWSKFDTRWRGVTIDTLLGDAAFEPPTPYVLAHSFDGYSTNVPLAELRDGKAMIALQYDGAPISAEHGGPARLLVPHLYFWKSAKYVNGLQFTTEDVAGFWELRGYHMHGDPWREQRYTDDP